MTIGELNRRIEVLEFIEDRDSFGAIIGEWITVARVWANLKTSIGSENLIDQQVKASQKAVITVRFYAGITVKHRVKYLDTIYEITGIKDIETGHRWTELTVKEVNGVTELLSETEES